PHPPSAAAPASTSSTGTAEAPLRACSRPEAPTAATTAGSRSREADDQDDQTGGTPADRALAAVRLADPVAAARLPRGHAVPDGARRTRGPGPAGTGAGTAAALHRPGECRPAGRPGRGLRGHLRPPQTL